MALIFCDSFDHYSTTSQKYDQVTSPEATINSTAGRFGNGLFSDTGRNQGQFVIKAFSTTYTTLIVGFNFQAATALNSAGIFLGFLESGTVHVDLRNDAGGHLQLTRNGTVLGTGATSLSTGVNYYIEVKVTISDTVGVAEIKINGVAELTLSSQDTRNGGSGVINQLKLGNFANYVVKYFDDLYVCDTSGSTNNTYLGDVRIESLFPNGNGNYSQFTGSDGNSVDNYLLVDETTPNEDTDYVEDSNVNDIDTYAYTDVTPTTGSVYGVQILPRARKTDAGSRSIRTVARLSGTDAVDSSDIALSTSYVYLPVIRETKPGGGSWTLTDVNNSEFGTKLTV